jgi:hypothetical protein
VLQGSVWNIKVFRKSAWVVLKLIFSTVIWINQYWRWCLITKFTWTLMNTVVHSFMKGQRCQMGVQESENSNCSCRILAWSNVSLWSRCPIIQ